MQSLINENSLDPCVQCSEFHSYSLVEDEYTVGFSGNSLKIIEDLKFLIINLFGSDFLNSIPRGCQG